MQKINLRTAIWIATAVLLLCLIPVGLLGFQVFRLERQNQELHEQAKISGERVTESIQRAENAIVKSQQDLDEFANQQGYDIHTVRDDLAKLGAQLEAVASTKAETKTVIHNNYISDYSTPSKTEVPSCPQDGRPIDVHGYTTRVETTKLRDSNGMRVADVSFAAAEKAPWSSKVHGVRYKILNSMGKNQDGRLILHTELTAEAPDAEPGKIFHIEGVESTIVQLPPGRARFDWWDPHVTLGVQLGLVAYPNVGFSAGFHLGFSIWSYGDHWRFLGITAGYDGIRDSFRASLVPVFYNLGDPIPFLEDLWIFADVSIDHRGYVGVGFGIATTL